tara:strand:+ start:42 stop:446 length:405 start_codon:yes stop_codon:yes gene_type:complete
MATVRTNISRTFSDLDLNFTKHPVRDDVNILTAERAVINSVKNLILTNHYERPFQPDLGSNIRRLLFENADAITASLLEREIQQTIENFEPRARVKDIRVIAKFDKNGFEVELTFYIVNVTAPITINFFLERIR